MKHVTNPLGLAVPGACYSNVVQVGDLVFLAGAIGQDAERRLVGDDAASQTRQALRNMADRPRCRRRHAGGRVLRDGVP